MLNDVLYVWACVAMVAFGVLFLFSLVSAVYGVFGVNFFDPLEEYDNIAQQAMTVTALIVLSNVSLVLILWLYGMLETWHG